MSALHAPLEERAVTLEHVGRAEHAAGLDVVELAESRKRILECRCIECRP